ncbi:MAG TPA: hypothetical protein DD417_17420 [Elusimicrobia bacterium]|nr:hypothetical protein [Elusimicrobiota bacterium]
MRPGAAAPKPAALELKAEDSFESRLLSAFWEACFGALGQAEDRLRPSEAAVWMLESLWTEQSSRMERLAAEKESLRARYLRNPSHVGGKEDFERLWRAGQSPLAEAAARTGRVEGGLRIFRDALAAQPESPDARLRLAVWQARSGRKAEARESFAKLASWSTKLPEAAWYRAALSVPGGDPR